MDNKRSETDVQFENDLDALFTLPLPEFTAARNALAARLKKGGRGDEAGRVKALSRPSTSAWTVNQLYWKHREAFDRLMATGQRFRQAQTSLLAGKVADIREPLDARRRALSDLSRLSASLLSDAGHNPTPEIIRRITTTLEAMSVHASLADAPRPGRLTGDLDPPGFESLAPMISSSGLAGRSEEPPPGAAAREVKDIRQASIAAAKVSLQNAERVLIETRASVRNAEITLRKATADVKEADRQKRKALELFEKASAAAEEADQRARSVAAEVKEAGKAAEEAERSVEEASQKVWSLQVPPDEN